MWLLALAFGRAVTREDSRSSAIVVQSEGAMYLAAPAEHETAAAPKPASIQYASAVLGAAPVGPLGQVADLQQDVAGLKGKLAKLASQVNKPGVALAVAALLRALEREISTCAAKKEEVGGAWDTPPEKRNADLWTTINAKFGTVHPECVGLLAAAGKNPGGVKLTPSLAPAELREYKGHVVEVASEFASYALAQLCHEAPFAAAQCACSPKTVEGRLGLLVQCKGELAKEPEKRELAAMAVMSRLQLMIQEMQEARVALGEVAVTFPETVAKHLAGDKQIFFKGVCKRLYADLMKAGGQCNVELCRKTATVAGQAQKVDWCSVFSD